MADKTDEWPAEPWVVSGPGKPDPCEIGCIYQEGEVDHFAVVDPDREEFDDYAQATARRICACVNAMAGIGDPEAFMATVTRAREWFAKGYDRLNPEAARDFMNSDGDDIAQQIADEFEAHARADLMGDER